MPICLRVTAHLATPDITTYVDTHSVVILLGLIVHILQ